MRIPIILGPTAVGKTELLIELSKKYNFQIISMDSRQVYKFMNIGTAKPTEEENKLIRHHLIDYVDPEEHYDVNKYLKDSKIIEEKLLSNGIAPVYAGGTGLYADAITKGLVEGIPGNDFVRKTLKNIDQNQSGYLYKILKAVDPVAFTRIHSNDSKRISRYLEAFILNGIPLSKLQNNDQMDKKYQIIFLNRDRKELHDRISKRVDSMINKGLFEEVLKLYKMGYNKSNGSFRTIGYSEVFDYLDGTIGKEECIELIKRNTRRYARRQIIWFRRYTDSIQINLSDTDTKNILMIFSIIFNDFWGDNYGRKI